MHKPPDGWPRISASIFYDDAGRAIDWLCRAFGNRTYRAEDLEGHQWWFMQGVRDAKPRATRARPNATKTSSIGRSSDG